MAMPGRNIVGDYRYNFQGQELDKETGKVAFELRLYDPRINRWLTTDPAGQYASPYLSMGNNWVNRVDPDGGEDDTIYENTNTGEQVEVNDGIDKTILVNDSDFQKAKFFANETGVFGATNSSEIAQGYYDFYDSVNSYDGLSFSNISDYLFTSPKLLVLGQPIGASGGIELIGGPASQGIKNGGSYLATLLGKTLKIQKHHIIPKAIFKKYPVLSKFLVRDGGFNLKKLPTPFHGNHPQYNEYVGRKIEQLIQSGNLNSSSLKSLQGQLNGTLNKAYDSGLKLNDYFRNFN
ncbi:RHS repeat-associated core domain-containing protein [Zobellia laminariae]|uniref:RHS repeat-associated core domain-containing protein n=1 Tax=Zobellia laminariae TaxID=248906 RepID=UPI0012D986A6|nr:hypothetical protein [Zobellia laminariae]